MAGQQSTSSKKSIGPKQPRQGNNKDGSGVWLFWLIIAAIFLIIANQPTTNGGKPAPKVTYSQFYAMVKTNKETGAIKKVTLSEGTENVIRGTFKDNSEFRLNIPADDKDLLAAMRENVSDMTVQPLETFWSQAFFSFVPVLLIIFFIWFVGRRGAEMGN